MTDHRPDPVVPTAELQIEPATPADAAELLVLQRCCWVRDAVLNETFDVPALHESLADVVAGIEDWSVWCVRQGPRLVGSVRGRLLGDLWEIGRLMVAPDLEGHGLGRRLLAHIEAVAPADAVRYGLFTGRNSDRNQRIYRRAGYHLTDDADAPDGHVPAPAVYLVKPRRTTAGDPHAGSCGSAAAPG